MAALELASTAKRRKGLAMKINDKIFGILLICLAVFVWMYSMTLPSLPGQKYGAGFFPAFTSIFIFGCGILLFIRGFKQEKGWLVVLGEWTKSPKLVSNICLIPGNLVFYMLVSNMLGFMLTVVVMLTFTIWWLRGHLLSAFVVAAASALSIYAFFSKLMLVPLPTGIFGL